MSTAEAVLPAYSPACQQQRWGRVPGWR